MEELILYWITQFIAGMFVVSLTIMAGMLFWLAYKIYKVPKHIWEENRKNPSKENFKKIMEYIQE